MGISIIPTVIDKNCTKLCNVETYLFNEVSITCANERVASTFLHIATFSLLLILKLL